MTSGIAPTLFSTQTTDVGQKKELTRFFPFRIFSEGFPRDTSLFRQTPSPILVQPFMVPISARDCVVRSYLIF